MRSIIFTVLFWLGVFPVYGYFFGVEPWINTMMTIYLYGNLAVYVMVAASLSIVVTGLRKDKIGPELKDKLVHALPRIKKTAAFETFFHVANSVIFVMMGNYMGVALFLVAVWFFHSQETATKTIIGKA